MRVRESYEELLAKAEELKEKIRRGEHVVINQYKLIEVGKKIRRLKGMRYKPRGT